MAEQQLTGRLLAAGARLPESATRISQQHRERLLKRSSFSKRMAPPGSPARTPQACSPRLKLSVSSSSAKATGWARGFG